MLKTLGAALLKDFVGLLKKREDFLSLPQKERRETLTHFLGADYPSVFLDYLSSLSFQSFTAQVTQWMGDLGQGFSHGKENGFLKAIAHYIAYDFSGHFDQLDSKFFYKNSQERNQTLLSDFPGDSALNSELRDLVASLSSQEIACQCYEALYQASQIPTIVIQSPLELGPSFRNRVRTQILQKYPDSFPEFQITPQMLGGIRILIGGSVVDYSWLSKIRSIAHLGATI